MSHDRRASASAKLGPDDADARAYSDLTGSIVYMMPDCMHSQLKLASMQLSSKHSVGAAIHMRYMWNTITCIRQAEHYQHVHSSSLTFLPQTIASH